MLSKMKAVSTGIGIAGTAPLIYAGYWLYSRATPTGIQLLEKEGYTFNKPTLANWTTVGKSCSENLFKDSLENDQKVYGCMTARMEKSNDDKGINFNSEVAVRKENQGGTIHTRIGHVEGSTTTVLKFDYLFSKGDLDTNKHNLKKSESWYFAEGSFENGDQVPKIYIKTPEDETKAWYGSDKYFKHKGGENASAKETPKFDKANTKEYAGVWISDSKGEDDGMLDKLEIGTKSRHEAEMFWNKDDTSANKNNYGSYYGEPIKKENYNEIDGEGYMASRNGDQIHSRINVAEKIQTLIDAIKDQKGKGVKMDDVCGYGSYRNIGASATKNLKMFCAKK